MSKQIPIRKVRRYASMVIAAIAVAYGVWQQQEVVVSHNPQQPVVQSTHTGTKGSAPPAGYAFELSGKVVQVADGDTFTLLVGSKRERVRMASIDAPETTKDSSQPGQPMAQASRKALQALISGKQLTLQCFEQDRYGRNVCDVPLGDGGTANQRQVASGMAWANMEGRGKFMRDRSLPELEEKARSQRIGLWGQQPQIRPWQWRYDCWKQGRC